MLQKQHAEVERIYIRDLTILGRQRDGDGQNKLLQIDVKTDRLKQPISKGYNQ